MKLNRFAIFSWGVLGYTIFVIIWGAFVRATGSGAGCGSHWPTCNGEIIPWSPTAETVIEFTHRLTSGAALLLTIVLLVWAFRLYPKGHSVRLGASLTMGFMILETLVGAALVLFQLVAYNVSTARAIIMAIHLVNTFLLLGAMTLTAWYATTNQQLYLKGQGRMGWALGLGFMGILLLAASGGVTALGNMLFPVETLMEGIRQDFSPMTHFLVRLRIYHPLIAISVGAYLVLMMYLFNNQRGTPTTRLTARLFAAIYVGQLLVGAFSVVLLAPVWMQLVHLFISDILLITLVLFLASAFAQPAPDAVDVQLTPENEAYSPLGR